MARNKKDAQPTATSTQMPTRPMGQLVQLDALIESNGVTFKFDQLPPVDDFVFGAVGTLHLKDKNTHAEKLFLGQNATRRTWALLKYWSVSAHKGSEVIFYNEMSNGLSLAVKELSEMALMYPFKVFKEKNLVQSIRHLSHFVQYIYLYTGKVSKVFPVSLLTAEEVLLSAVGTIYTAYEKKGKPGDHNSFLSTEY